MLLRRAEPLLPPVDLLAAVGLLGIPAEGDKGDPAKTVEESVLVLDLALAAGVRSADSPWMSDESMSDGASLPGKDNLFRLLPGCLCACGDATVLSSAVALLDLGSSSPASADPPGTVLILEEGLLLVAPGCIEGWLDIA